MRRLLIVDLLRHLLRAASVMVLVSVPVSAQQIVSDLSTQPTGRTYFNSTIPEGKWELVRRKFDRTPMPIWGTLYPPESLQGPVPAMMIPCGSAGPQQEDVNRWVRLFNQVGMAAFMVDLFGPHDIANMMDSQSQLDSVASDADTLSIFKLLNTDPRTDPKRISQIGFPCGGGVSLGMALDAFRKGVIDDDTQFTALTGFYPGYSALWREIPSLPLTGASLMLTLGGKDGYTPTQLYRNATETMQCDGQAVKVHVYPSAYRDFDNTRAYFKYFPGATTTHDCPQTLIDVQHDACYRLPDGEKYANLQAMRADYTRCITRDVSTGINPEQAKRTEADVSAFLVKAMGLSPRQYSNLYSIAAAVMHAYAVVMTASPDSWLLLIISLPTA